MTDFLGWPFPHALHWAFEDYLNMLNHKVLGRGLPHVCFTQPQIMYTTGSIPTWWARIWLFQMTYQLCGSLFFTWGNNSFHWQLARAYRDNKPCSRWNNLGRNYSPRYGSILRLWQSQMLVTGTSRMVMASRMASVADSYHFTQNQRSSLKTEAM